MQDEVEIRAGTVDDLDRVLDLAVEQVVESRSSLRPGVTDQQIREARAKNFEQLESVVTHPDCGLFVAVDREGRHVGHVLLLGNAIDSVSDLPQAWVYDLSVQRDWWGKGIGKRLMAEAEAFVKSRGLEWIGLGVTVANQRALQFYQHLGYETERVQMIKQLGDPS